ncbi:MAG: ParB/RepB/Spo0J family partition protein [Candidatus Rokubacteria bacterium]|nr:ParB/RepB/Spo0J family partition protein [Candidatus Rokubacteria bacterium]MBI2492304.1 ParB/RepB/Spo0J family partition protein [Candidatus Rokubacteria bacterium]
MHKRGLGRGLGALLSATPSEGESLIEIPVDQIEANPHQPRKAFDFKSLGELAASIKASGVIQPVIVRRHADGYQLIAGERRWRAARQAGLERIPALVRDATDAQSLELALIENLLREDLNPMEEAEAYQKLLAQFSWTQEELAQRIGKDRSSIANCLRLLKLPAEIQADLRGGRLTMGHARALLALPTDAEQLRLRDEILARDWSVRATEDSVRAAEELARKRGAPVKRARRRSAELAALEEALQRALMTRVRIVGNDRTGKIEVVYASADELERLSELLGARR